MCKSLSREHVRRSISLYNLRARIGSDRLRCHYDRKMSLQSMHVGRGLVAGASVGRLEIVIVVDQLSRVDLI